MRPKAWGFTHEGRRPPGVVGPRAAARGEGAQRFGRISVPRLRRLAARLPAGTDQTSAVRKSFLSIDVAVTRKGRVLRRVLCVRQAAVGVPPFAVFHAA